MIGLTRFYRCAFSNVYRNYTDGQFIESKSDKFFDVRSPVTQELIGRTPQSTPEEMDYVIARAAEAFKTWSKVPLTSKLYFLA